MEIDEGGSHSEQGNSADVNSKSWVSVYRKTQGRMVNSETAAVDHSASPSGVKSFL